ncbi:diguanylate cyclase [Terribacillus saccharophilus]|uniref:GGDEF domain-containing response regulator n=1 Tax=Terribacillus saccharophilus TaxID=361277 RepID=UPI0039821F82
MKKYQEIFTAKINESFAMFKQQDMIRKGDLYQIVHQIKGTGASIGLNTLSEVAEDQLHLIAELEGERLPKDNWMPIIEAIEAKMQQQAELPSRPREFIRQEPVLLISSNNDWLMRARERIEKEGLQVIVAADKERAIAHLYDAHPLITLIDGSWRDHITKEDTVYVQQKMFSLIMFIGGNLDFEEKQRYFRNGITDIIDQHEVDELVIELIFNRLKLLDTMEQRVVVDPLTQVYNRSFLASFPAGRESELTCAVLDLDNFKQVNDTYGHASGDIVLRNFAAFLKGAVREEDYVVRFGGEEFLLLMPGITSELAANRLREILEGFMHKTHELAQTTIYASFTAGVASKVNDERFSLDELIEQADQALYFGKRNGKQQVNVYESCQHQMEEGPYKTLYLSVVDDDRIIRSLLSDSLEGLRMDGYRVQLKAFAAGSSLLESDWIRQAGKHIVLLDGVMPDMDGLEVLTALRTYSNEKNVFVMMLTGRQDNQDVVKALELGADDYMTKPFHVEEVAARIKRLTLRT